MSRDEYIRYLYQCGLKVNELAKEYNLSHQRISVIIKDDITIK
jgi:Mor family transcriptional regulator